MVVLRHVLDSRPLTADRRRVAGGCFFLATAEIGRAAGRALPGDRGPLGGILAGALRVWRRLSDRVETPDGRGWRRKLLGAASFPATLILFTIPVIAGSLSEKRSHTFESSEFFLLPWSDAGNYYMGSQAVLAEGKLLPWCGRRPINTLTLATRLALTGNDFRSAMLVECLILGLIVWAYAAVVARFGGEWARLFITGCLFAVGRQWAATTLSETLGLIWGTLAAALLWEAIHRGWRLGLALGLFCLVVGLNCRAGAFLSVPLIALWGGSAASGCRAFDWKNVAVLGLAASCGFFLQMACLAVYADRADLGHGNFAHVLYNMSTGKPGWTEIYTDYPECRALPEAELIEFIYDKARQRIRANPALLMAGYFRGFLAMAREILDFVTLVFFLPSAWWSLAGVGLFTVGFIRLAWSHWRCPRVALILANFLGVFASLPVLVASGARTLAASYPLLLLIVVVVLDGAKASSNDEVPARSPTLLWSKVLSRGLAFAALLLAVAPLVGPLLARATRRYQAPAAASAPPETDTSLVLLGPGIAHLEVLDDRDLPATLAPRVRRTDFERRLDAWSRVAECGLDPTPFTGPMAIMLLCDLTPGRPRELGWAVGPVDLLHHGSGWWRIALRQEAGGYSVISRSEPLPSAGLAWQR